MPQGDKSSYTSKQKRQAHHIEESAKKRGYSAKRAAQIGYATVNKQDGGGKKKSASKKRSTKGRSSKGSTAHAASRRRQSNRSHESRAHA